MKNEPARLSEIGVRTNRPHDKEIIDNLGINHFGLFFNPQITELHLPNVMDKKLGNASVLICVICGRLTQYDDCPQMTRIDADENREIK